MAIKHKPISEKEEQQLDMELKLSGEFRALPKATPNNNKYHEKEEQVPFVKQKKQTGC